jgi:two-component system, cell cycle sensor histidine kinase and response regulator CckA
VSSPQLDHFHPLLRRQWRRHVGRDHAPTEEWLPLLHAVSAAYGENDTARRLVERALALSSDELHSANAELRGVLRVLPDILFRVGADDRIGGVMQGSTIAGHAALRALMNASTPAAEMFRRAIEQVRATRVAAAFEYQDGGDRGSAYYEVRLLPFVDADIIGVVRDVSDRKQAERDRLVLGKLESTGILAGGIAHDFNNLLTTMLLNLDLAASDGTPATDMAEHLATIRQGVLAAQVLTQQLITFARGGAAMRQSVVLTSLLQDSVPLALSGSNVRSDIVVAPDLWPTEVDIGQMGQVIRNLVLNAREAMPGGGVVKLRAGNITLSSANTEALPHGKYVQIVVTDQGYGISAEALPKIFDPYFSTKIRGVQKGMGLGLTICHAIVQKHGGTITVESTLGQGACFAVYLPATTKTASVTPAAPASADHNRPRGRVLVMDDEPMVRNVFKTVLNQIGYDAELARDGRAAVDLYTKAQYEGRPFDAVILDLTVKGEMGGQAAARVLHALDPAVSAIVMSGYSDDDVMRHYDRHGFKARLVKPFDRDMLRDVLAQVIKAKR